MQLTESEKNKQEQQQSSVFGQIAATVLHIFMNLGYFFTGGVPRAHINSSRLRRVYVGFLAGILTILASLRFTKRVALCNRIFSWKSLSSVVIKNDF